LDLKNLKIPVGFRDFFGQFYNKIIKRVCDFQAKRYDKTNYLLYLYKQWRNEVLISDLFFNKTKYMYIHLCASNQIYGSF
jgi:hypothetical protein